MRFDLTRDLDLSWPTAQPFLDMYPARQIRTTLFTAAELHPSTSFAGLHRRSQSCKT
jgi:hypothetical protein